MFGRNLRICVLYDCLQMAQEPEFHLKFRVYNVCKNFEWLALCQSTILSVYFPADESVGMPDLNFAVRAGELCFQL